MKTNETSLLFRLSNRQGVNKGITRSEQLNYAIGSRYLLLLLIVFFTMQSKAQNEPKYDINGDQIDLDDVDKGAFVASGASHSSNAVSNFRLVSTLGETMAAVNLGFQLGEKFSTNLEVTSPTSSSGTTRPIGLDGLSSDGKLTFGFQYRKLNGLNNVFKESIKDSTNKMAAFKSLRKNLRQERRETRNDINRNKRDYYFSWMIGGTITIAKQHFEYATDSTLTNMANENGSTFSESIYLGRYFGRSQNTLIRITYLHKSSIIGNPESTFLEPFNGGSTLIQRQVAIGKPIKASGQELKFEGVSALKNIGFNPSIVWLLDEGNYSIDFPIYLISGKDKSIGLNAGIYGNYTSDLSSPLSFGVFIGSSLSKILEMNSRNN